ncbi:MAG: LPS export ABC transporter periplasmic protein LptC [Ignavibacteriaceae bacterium]|nr:LPS export ABC transporter periplasmic protein LptC [Ignavibacteriaceae bacterium]
MRLLLPAFLLFILLTGCDQEKIKPEVNTNLKPIDLPDQESWDSEVLLIDSSGLRAVITSGHIRVFYKNKETFFEKSLKVDFYNEQSIKTTTLTADRGRIDDETKDLYAYGNVVAVNDSGVVLKSDELIWRNGEQKIRTDKFVTITTRYESIQGYGFESDQYLRNYVIYKINYITTF